MSRRARVLKTYKVEYGEGSFPNRQDAVSRFLANRANTLPNLVLYSDDSVMELNPIDLQVVVDGLRKGIYDKEVDACSYEGWATSEEIADIFESWLNNYDKSNSFLRVEWW